MTAPSIDRSSREERQAYVRERFQCISDCDQCGLCQLLRGASAEQALDDYIEGRRELKAVLMGLRHA